jgi:hypothetical protein
MSNFETSVILFFCIAMVVLFITALIAGATKRVVIYYNFKDFFISCLPAIALLPSLFFLDSISENGLTNSSAGELIPVILSFAGFIFFLGWSIKSSILYNRSIIIGLFIGMVKCITATLGIFIIIGKIAKILDETVGLKATIWAAIIVFALGWLGASLINGKEVYEQKGWDLV